MPCHHRLPQRGAINWLASIVIQRSWLCGIDMDFVIVARHHTPKCLLVRLEHWMTTNWGAKGSPGADVLAPNA
jgi:hypothetical protein